MKKIALLFFAFLLLLSGGRAAHAAELKGSITISGAWAIYPTAVAWADAFRAKHPEVRIDISAGGAGKGAADAIAGLADIGMVSREPDPAELKKGVTPVYILHDAVFPIVSERNPSLDGLLKKGIAKDKWSGLYITGLLSTWDEVAGTKTGKKVHVYTRSDSCGAAASWAKYIGNKKQEDLKGVGVYGDPGLVEAVRRDPLGIGYSNFSFVFTREGAVAKGIKLVPIDANGNGKADPDEVFKDRDSAIKAIEAGRYPATRKNYFFVKEKPQGHVLEFIRFALSDEGARIVDEVGTSLPIPKAEREKVLKSLQ
ncbi:MAG: substrate-binding domain-containing protein [Thermodesulfobacteriota bacterium]|nr:MAG: substrate-binding domain-containing protein [Thermodesulfobacteriota bacterium]